MKRHPGLTPHHVADSAPDIAALIRATDLALFASASTNTRTVSKAIPFSLGHFAMAGFFDFFRRRESGGSRPAPSAAIRDLAFSEIKKTWSAEESDITERENGFDWLPASHKVHVRILREEEGDDPSRHRLWVTTEFLHSVGSDEKTAVEIGTLTPVICPTFSPVRWTKGGSRSEPTNLQFFSSIYVSDDNVGAFSSLLARMSVLQPFMAERAADDFASFLRGTPALATGSKRQTESVVSHIGDMVRGKSDGISDWTGSPEFEAFVEQYAQNDDCFGTADRTACHWKYPSARTRY